MTLSLGSLVGNSSSNFYALDCAIAEQCFLSNKKGNNFQYGNVSFSRDQTRVIDFPPTRLGQKGPVKARFP
jgi:hypothetical protein